MVLVQVKFHQGNARQTILPAVMSASRVLDESGEMRQGQRLETETHGGTGGMWIEDGSVDDPIMVELRLWLDDLA